MVVPFIDLKRFEEDFLSKWNEKAKLLSKNATFVGGEEVNSLEEKLAQLLEVNHCISCANGTDAIQLALRALGVGRGDNVIVPNMTFWATFEAVVNVGATPSTIDCCLNDGGVDYNILKTAIYEIKPKAVIVAHLYGWASHELLLIRKLCKEENIFLIEDGAQSFGVKINNESIYKDALISTVSFYPAKVLGAAGDGGAVFTNNKSLAEKVRCLSNHGRSSHYGYSDIGWNSRLDALQAAFLNLAVLEVDKRIESRINSANFYRSNIELDGLRVMDAPPIYQENGYCNVCIVTDNHIREALIDTLKNEEVGFGIIYPSPLSRQQGAKEFLHRDFDNGNTEEFCKSVINLPLFPYMTQDELSFVVETVNKIKV